MFLFVLLLQSVLCEAELLTLSMASRDWTSSDFGSTFCITNHSCQERYAVPDWVKPGSLWAASSVNVEQEHSVTLEAVEFPSTKTLSIWNISIEAQRECPSFRAWLSVGNRTYPVGLQSKEATPAELDLAPSQHLDVSLILLMPQQLTQQQQSIAVQSIVLHYQPLSNNNSWIASAFCFLGALLIMCVFYACSRNAK